MKNLKTGLRMLNARRDVTLMAATAIWNAGAEAESRITAVVFGAVTGAKAGASFRNPWAIAIGAAAGAAVSFVAHVHTHAAVPHQSQAAA